MAGEDELTVGLGDLVLTSGPCAVHAIVVRTAIARAVIKHGRLIEYLSASCTSFAFPMYSTGAIWAWLRKGSVRPFHDVGAVVGRSFRNANNNYVVVGQRIAL